MHARVSLMHESLLVACVISLRLLGLIRLSLAVRDTNILKRSESS